MMSTTQAQVFGLYELSGDGTVLYSRNRGEPGLSGASAEVVGRDYFHDIAPFDNTGDLRRHFRRFLTDNRPSDTFIFDCLLDNEVVRAKVFMTRAYEVDHDHAGGIVIMDIRQPGE